MFREMDLRGADSARGGAGSMRHTYGTERYKGDQERT